MVSWQVCCLQLLLHLWVGSSQVEIDVETGYGDITKGARRAAPHASWTPYIHCQTCQYGVEKMYEIYESFRQGPDWSEDTLIDIISDICNPFSNIGLWTTTIDLYVDVERYLTFDQNDKFGMCQRECETIARACAEVLSDQAEEIAEWVWQHQEWVSKQSMTDYICDSYCAENDGKVKVPKKKRKRDRMGKEQWVEMSDEELARRRGQLESVPRHQRRWANPQDKKDL